MPSPDVYISFAGDTSGLTDSVKKAQDSIQGFSVSTAARSAETAAALAAVIATVGKLTGATKALSDTSSSFAVIQDGAIALGGAVVGIEALKAAFSTFQSGMQEQREVAQGTAAAIKNYAESQAYIAQYAPIAEVANQGLIASIGRVGIAFDQWQRSAQIYSSGLLQLEGVALAASGNIDKVQAAAGGAGFDNATRYLQSLTAELAKIPGMTDQGAASIEAMFGSMQNYSGALNESLVEILPKLASNQDQAQKLAQTFASFFSNPANNWNELAAAVGRISPGLQAAYEAAQRTQNVNQMQAAGYGAIIGLVQRLGQEKTRQLQEDLQSYAQLGPLGMALSAGIRSQVDQAIAFNAELDKILAKMREQQSVMANKPLTPDQSAAAAAAQAAAGIPLQETELTNAQQALSLGADQLRDAKARAAALREEAAAVTDIATKTQLSTQAAQAELQVRTEELGLVKARNAQTRATAGGSNDAQAGLAEARANQAAINQVYASGTPERIEAETAVLQAQKQVDDERKQSAADAEDAIYAKSQASIQQRIALLQQEGKDHVISAQDEVSQLSTSLNQQLALEQSHFQKLKQIWGDGTTQFDDAQKQLATITNSAGAEQQKTLKEVNQQIYDDYKQSFEKIGDSVSSSLTGMAEGQMTLREAAQNMLKQLLSDFISARVKMVADWAAGIATQNTMTVASQTAQTAAVQTGVAARTAAQASGASGGIASDIAAAMQSIMTSAGKAAAGVFGFLAPIMGPAAAAPAAAAEGTALGFAKFDVGSWQLPSDQLAMVHRGEMIVPAAQTPWAQSLMANAGGGGNGQGGDTHNHTWNVANHFAQPLRADDVMYHVEKNIGRLAHAAARHLRSQRYRP